MPPRMRRPNFMRCTVSPARWLQIYMSRASLSAARSIADTARSIDIESELGDFLADIGRQVHHQAGIDRMHMGVMLPGDAQDIRAQRFGQHLHATNLELDELLVLQRLATLLARLDNAIAFSQASSQMPSALAASSRSPKMSPRNVAGRPSCGRHGPRRRGRRREHGHSRRSVRRSDRSASRSC